MRTTKVKNRHNATGKGGPLQGLLESGSPLLVGDELRAFLADDWMMFDPKESIDLANPVVIDGRIRMRVNGYVGDSMVSFFHELEAQYHKHIAGTDREGEFDEIVISLNSFGGSVTHGFEIVDMVEEWNRTNPVKLSFLASGAVYSMGVPIVLSGYHRYSYPNAMFLVHSVSGMGWGAVRDIEDLLDRMQKLNGRLMDYIATKSGMKRSDLEEAMSRDTTWTAEEAVALGIVEEVLEEEPEEEETEPGEDPEEQGNAEAAKESERAERIRALRIKNLLMSKEVQNA